MAHTAIVVGAGLGGLAAAIALRRAGWKVTVLETAAQVGEVGAGIQVPPNSSRILLSWGLRSAMEAVVCSPETAHSWRYENMSPLQLTPFKTEERYEFPYWHIHRADFHTILLNEALAKNLSAPCDNAGPPIDLVTNCTVQEADCDAGKVVAQDGRTFTAELVVGADGVRSVVKKFVTLEPDNAQASGDQAYRFLIPMELVEKDPELQFATKHAVHNWWGPDSHCVHYPVRKYKLVNVVAIGPDDQTSVESWNAEGSLDDVMKIFAPYDRRLHKLFRLATSYNKWRLLKRAPLDRWVRGRTCLLGDSCHAMVPYLAQGAAMAVEDAAALAIAVSSGLSIDRALEAYQRVRLPRTTAISSGADNNRTLFHMRDGPGQKARDEMVTKSRGQVSNVFDKAWRYDAVAEMKEGLAEFGVKL